MQSLVVLSGSHRASRFELPTAPATLTIGRSPEVDIALDDRDVSRIHAEIAVKKEGIVIRDLNSRNGLIVDGERVASATIAAGERFTIGKTTIALETPADRSLSVIFEAPEEDTSSFAMMAQKKESKAPETKPSLSDAPSKASKKQRETGDAGSEEMPPDIRPPIGPVDPLVGSDTDPPKWRTDPTTTSIEVERRDDRTDFGLIVVGAVILLASVAALIYLFS